MIFEVSIRMSVISTAWERLFAFVFWVVGYCYTLAVETADFLVALLSLWHTARYFIPEYFNFQNTSLLLMAENLGQKYC